MDSTTVDYAINKLNEALTQIAPTAIKLGDEFVSYTVLKAVMAAIVLPLLMAVFTYTAYRLFLKATNTRGDDEGWVIAGMVSGAMAFIIALFAAGAIYNGILAVAYPLMYTIEHLAK